MKGQDNPLIPNPHPHLLNSAIMNPIIVPSSYQHKKTQKPRKAIRTTEISQFSGPIDLVADKTIYKEYEDRVERVATTASSLDAEQDSELAKMGYEKPSQRLTFYKAFFSPQWNFLIHTITQCLSAKTTAWNEFSSTMASVIICLATNQNFNLSKYIFNAMSRRKQKKTTTVPHPSDSTADVLNEEYVPTHSNDPLLSGEDRLKLTDLMDMCTKLSERVLNLEHTKTAQAQEITNLKLRVKKLEKKARLRTHKFKRLYKIGVTRRVEYPDDLRRMHSIRGGVLKILIRMLKFL
ncbi:hypothetical protein Tco_1487941 [Tanacetum coccineum]